MWLALAERMLVYKTSLKHDCVRCVEENYAEYTTEEDSAGAEMSEALNGCLCCHMMGDIFNAVTIQVVKGA